MKHRNVEFHVTHETSVVKKIITASFRSSKKAFSDAVQRSLFEDGGEVYVDVLVNSVEGARAWSGDEGAELYKDDPEASVFERISVRVTSLGKVP